MNDLSHSVGLLSRQVKDAQAGISNLQHHMRRLVDGRASAFDRPGGLVARMAACTALGFIAKSGPDAVARAHFTTDRDLDRMLVQRAATSPAMTTVATWAAELAQTIVQDLADRFIPESTLIQLRRASGSEYTLVGGASIKVPTWAPTATGGFIGEGSAIPVSRFVFGSLSLTGKKAANIIAVSDELMSGSPLDVEQMLRNILGESVSLMLDAILLDANAATAVRPAGLLNGVTPLTASAATPAASAMIADLKALAAAIAPAARPTLIMNEAQALALGLLAPTASPAVLVSTAVPAGRVIGIDAAAFASAVGIPNFRASEHATLHEEDTSPLALGTGTQGSGILAVPTRGTFQTDTTALRTIIPTDWALRRSGAVAVVNSVVW